MLDTPRRRATIHDVAAEAGVSRGTVSRVLNGSTRVSPEARAAVEAAIHRVGYVPNTAARNLVRQRSGTVGFLVHEPHGVLLNDSNIGDVLLGANGVVSDADRQLVVLVVDSEQDTQRVGDHLRGGLVDGVVIISTRDDDALLTLADDIGLPTVLIGRPQSGPELPYVSIDNRAAARSITRRLMDTGRERIGMLACALDRDSGADRLHGFTEAMADRFDPELVVRRAMYTYDEGQDAMAELLDRRPDVDGVFAASDSVAAGALATLRERGLTVPRDVGLVGFDDSAWATRCDPPLSTVRQPARLLGEVAAQKVLMAIDGRPDAERATLLPTSIVWRVSA